MNEGNAFRFDLWLHNEMQKRGWNTTDMAEASGLTHVTIGYYLRNTRTPTLYSFGMILKALGKHIIIEDD